MDIANKGEFHPVDTLKNNKTQHPEKRSFLLENLASSAFWDPNKKLPFLRNVLELAKHFVGLEEI